jgi:hypothetical protein
MDSAGNVLAHHCGLYSTNRIGTNREDTVALHEDRLRSVAAECCDNALSDRAISDHGEWADRDFSTKLISHCRQDARD